MRCAVVVAGQIPGAFGESPREYLLANSPVNLPDEFDIVEWSRQPSCHYTLSLTYDLAELLRSLARDGYDGFIVVSGADVLDEMAYLVDLLWNLPHPVIFVGVTTSVERASSSTFVDVVQALTCISESCLHDCGVMILNMGNVLAASEVIKVSNYKGPDFLSLNRGPIAEVLDRNFFHIRTPERPVMLRDDPIVPAKGVELVWTSLGGGEGILAALAKSRTLKGLVIAGFGSGNVTPSWLPHIKAILKEHIPVVVTSRCAYGRVLPAQDFEGSSRRLMEMGVFDGGNLLPQQARIRLAVGLGAGLEDEELQAYLRNEAKN